MPEVPLESGSIVNGGAFIGCVILRAWDKRIGGAKSIRAVGPISTIDTDPSFPFSDCPLDWVKNQANNKVKKNKEEEKETEEAIKGKPNVVMFERIDKKLDGQVAAKLRSIRPPEP